MLYDAKEKRVHSYVGVGTAPAKATIALFRDKGHKTVPEHDILAQFIPAPRRT